MAVYTTVSEQNLDRFLSQYDVGTVISCTGIAEGINNSNFLLITSKQKYILTLFEKRARAEDLPFYMKLMQHLYNKKIPCPQPIQNRTGGILGTLQNKPAAMFSFLEGTSPERIDLFHCTEIGQTLSRMHLAVGDFRGKKTSDLSLKNWGEIYTQIRDHIDSYKPDLATSISQELDFLQQNWPENLPAGAIHADITPYNVFFKDKKLSGIFDFYFSCTDFFAYDVASCINEWCFEKDYEFNISKARVLLNAYQKSRPLSEQELTALPVLCRGNALCYTLTRLEDRVTPQHSTLTKIKDPELYLKKLYFHQNVQSVTEYGLDTENEIASHG